MGSARTSTPSRTRWQKTARRIRVPLGFVVAAIFLVFAHPTWPSLLLSLLPVSAGLWLRAYAAGYVRKNAELTRTGPYAYTRNPLYLGSICLAVGFSVAAGRWWLIILLVAMFLAIYIPTILSEEAYLRGIFPTFDAYAAKVPRLFPRITPARFPDVGPGTGRFQSTQYTHHREYNASIGAAAIYAALLLRMFLLKRF